MKPASLSVVIPTYNSSRFLLQAIKSAAAQTVPPSEIIVVDDGSTDDTQGLLAPYLGRIRYLAQEKRGASAARNRGAEAATGDFVAFLDADDVWHPRKVELQLRAMAGEPDLGLLATATFDWPATAFPAVDDRADGRVIRFSWSQLVVRTSLLTSSVLARRATLDRAGPFDVTLQGPEDRDLFLRVAEACPVARLDLPLTGYRDVRGSLSKQVVTCEAGMREILHRIDARGGWQGRRVLRRKAISTMYHTCAYLHGAQGDHRTALSFLLRSFAWYPLPYRRDEVRTILERPKRLAVNILRALRLKPAEPHPPAALANGLVDAVEAMADPFAAESLRGGELSAASGHATIAASKVLASPGGPLVGHDAPADSDPARRPDGWIAIP